MAEAEAAAPQFHRAKHIAYWRRCHETFLPAAYTSNDSTRLTFAFFILAALDLLSVPLTREHCAATRAWVLGLQHPDGGFCGSPSHAITGRDAHRGTANLAATFFALLLLGMSAETEEQQREAFVGVDRGKTLRWLRKLQRKDGSFGQVLWEGEPVGGWDMRHSYLAAGIRWMLRGEGDGEEDVDVEGMVQHIRGVHTYDGGISESSQQESHAGYAYCAVAALTLLDRVPRTACRALQEGISDRPGLLKWLAHRQFVYLSKSEELQDESEVNYVEAKLGGLDLNTEDAIDETHRHVGLNGRWNKKADTCYAWWAGGSLHLLETPGLFAVEPARNYLLEITQHSIGGFSKNVGGPPDLYHSYLGLAALAMMGGAGLKELDVGICCSKETAGKIARAREGLLLKEGRRGGGDGWATDEFWKTASGKV